MTFEKSTIFRYNFVYLILWVILIAYLFLPNFQSFVDKNFGWGRPYSGKVIKIYRSRGHYRNQLVVDIAQNGKIKTISIYHFSDDCQKFIQIGDSIKTYKNKNGIYILRNGDSLYFEYLDRVSSINRYEIVEDSAIYYRKSDKLYLK